MIHKPSEAAGPPKLGQWLLERITHADCRYSALGDFEEIYGEMVKKRGRTRADFWYWRQVITSLLPFVLDRIYWSIVMLKNYLIVALRNIKKHKSYSLINILGLALGMACCILIFLWVQDELSYDRFHKKADRIYRVESELQFANGPTIWPITPAQLAPAWMQDFPEVENAVRMHHRSKILVRNGENTFYETRFYSVSASVFDIFTYSFLKGDPASALTNPNSVVITEEISRKYFGNQNPIGQTFEINREHELTVTGVIENIPDNSHLKMDFIAPFSFCELLGENLDDWGRFDFPTYVILREGVSQADFEPKIAWYLKKHREDSDTRLLLTPLTKIHLYTASGGGDIGHVYLFSLIGLIVLCVACINFINLSTARSAQRRKEIGVRKVVGARRTDLVYQLLGECILMTFFAFLLALVLVILFLSPFNELSGKHFTISAALNKDTLFGLFAIMFMAGIFSGAYPALYLSSFHPIKVLKGSLREGLNDSLIRKILVTVQFSVSIILIISAIVIMNQINFIRNKKLGFDKEHLVYVNLNGEARQNIDALKAEMLKNPNIIGAAAADRVPVNQGNFTTINDWEGKSTDNALIFNVMSVDHDYLDLLGLKIVKGRKFSKDFTNDGVIVNEEAVRQMGMASPLGKKLDYWWGSGVITGVISDYHFKPLHKAITPLIITNNPSSFRVLFVKIRPENVFDTINALRQTFLQIAPAYPFEYFFLDERIDSLYRAEMRTGLIINWFTFLTIFTSCLGLFGLAAFMAQNRTKEIGIRKVLGASVFKIVSLLSTKFAKLVLLANIIAWPIGYLAMSTWLQNYAYRIDLGLWTFVLSASVVLTIALLTVSFQSIKAALANPVEALKYE